MENRDRKYDTDIIRLRGHYNVQNNDFDLSQFGLFLNNDIIFIVVHFNTMIDLVGRKLMVGDVIELPHLLDDYPLDTSLKYSLKRYYQITDATVASEGYSLTWYSHLWRIKCEPLTDSQEFSDILDAPQNTDNYTGSWSKTTVYPAGYTVTFGGKTYISKENVPVGLSPPDETYWMEDTEPTTRDIVSRYANNIAINDAMLAEASRLVPLSGFDVTNLYVVPTYDEVGTPGNTANIGNDGLHHPAPPKDLVTGSGPPDFSGSIVEYINPQYKNSSMAIKIPRSQLADYWNTTVDADSELKEFVQFSMKMVSLEPDMIGSGSGSVEATNIIVANTIGSVMGPYGTADNTYSSADQYVSLILTANITPARSSTIYLITEPKSDMIGLLVRSVVTSTSGQRINVFPPNTTITDVNISAKTITVSSPAISSMPAGTGVQIAYNFTGVVTPDMDYRADCDPRFRYIARRSPRGFGYLAGYLTGDGTAPNGYPAGRGISFPSNPRVGDYFLRIDYLPQVLFRWDGNIWARISSNVRTPLYLQGGDGSQRATFINNTDTIELTDGTVVPQKQALSTVLKIKPDN